MQGNFIKLNIEILLVLDGLNGILMLPGLEKNMQHLVICPEVIHVEFSFLVKG